MLVFSSHLCFFTVAVFCAVVGARSVEKASLDPFVSDAAVRALFNRPSQQEIAFQRAAAPENAFPYVVGLREWRSHDHLCTGALISQRWVVTAASCANSKEAGGFLEGGSVYVGSTDLMPDPSALIPIRQIITHPEYELEKDVYDARFDIALVELEKGVDQRSVRLPYPSDGCCANQTVVSVGWPTETFRGPHELQLTMMSLPYLPFNECSPFLSEFEEELPEGNSFLAGDTFCAAGVERDWCVDEGSPLVLPTVGDDILVAMPSRVAETCRFGDPFFFTRIAPLTDWILSVEGVQDDVTATYERLIFPKQGGRLEGRVARGVDAVSGNQPFVAGILVSGSHQCTGVLVRSEWVLTTANCLPEGSNLESTEVHIGGILLEGDDGFGMQDGERITVQATFENTSLEVSGVTALLNASIDHGCLGRNVKEGDFHTVYGWGRTSQSGAFSSRLQIAQMPIAPNDACEDMEEGSICVGDDSSSASLCAGDVGAPLVKLTERGERLVGIRVAPIGLSGCDTRPNPFVSAASLNPWIVETVKS